MSLHVNLLRPSECRRQGLVGGAFIVRLSVGLVAALIALFGALTVMRSLGARQQLAAARELWKAREPVYKEILAMKQNLATYRKLAQELNGWSSSRIDWHPPLRALQELVDPAMQLRRLNIRGDTELKTRKAAAARDGAAKEGAGSKAAPPPAPVRQFFLMIEGRAVGQMAEDVILEFDARLRRAPAFRTILDSVRLQRLQSDLTADGQAADRLFAIEAITPRKEMP